MIYDAFAHVPIYGLEALGFVAKGDAGAFIADGNTEPGGWLPLNTNGGGLSYTHTGMYGMFAIQEGVRQVRGEAAGAGSGRRHQRDRRQRRHVRHVRRAGARAAGAVTVVSARAVPRPFVRRDARSTLLMR